MKPTIKSIASMCGVSRGTVDRVLNDRPYVSADVRKKVLRAVQVTGYVHPRKNAPSDRGVQIGFLIAKWESGYFRQQVERGIRRAERVLRPGELSLHIETMGSRSDREYIQRIDALLAAGANGIILNAADNVLLRSKIEQLAARGIPVVTYNSDLPTSSRVCQAGPCQKRTGCRRAARAQSGRAGPHPCHYRESGIPVPPPPGRKLLCACRRARHPE